MVAPYDILGLGCVAIDDLIYVPYFPEPDSKIQVTWRDRQCGGLTATALVAAARTGATCLFAGTLGTEELSQFVLDRLAQEGIDISYVRRRADVRPIHSTILVDEARQTRTILYSLHGTLGAQPDWPDADVIRAARVLFVDHYGVEGMIRAVHVAQSAGIPVVADFERNDPPGFVELLSRVDHLIVSERFAVKLTGLSSPRESVQALAEALPTRTAVVTCGAEGCWYMKHGERAPHHAAAFSVPVRDTTGCGDVFHGAYATALARGWETERRIRFASAAAALKAMQRGGQAGIPTADQVERFLADRL